MAEHPDVVLAVIPLLVGSGLAIQSIAVAGISTTVVTAPIAAAGYLAALAVVLGELLVGPVTARATES